MTALVIGLVSGCGAVSAGGGASTGSGTKPSAATTTRSFTLKPPPAPEGQPVLLARQGFGPGVASKPIKVDGSYTVYATCHGGSEVMVVSIATKSETKVICSGYTSTLRYLTESTTDSFAVKADKEQEWMFTVADTVEPK